ncbi:MAG: hypothetical protein HY809_07550 [Nitrospirae bacterium]|nr:hypothetical protein [Nitrospirota bacterium]
MGRRIKIAEKSNWETIAFLVINDMLGGSNRVFARSQLMSANNLQTAIDWSIALGHKEKPEKPEETLQKTIQNMRDKDYIKFLGRGDYKLTLIGLNKMKEVVNKVNELLEKINSMKVND